jgi:hypothetical protein
MGWGGGGRYIVYFGFLFFSDDVLCAYKLLVPVITCCLVLSGFLKKIRTYILCIKNKNKLFWFDGSIYILVKYTTGCQICE